MCSPGSPNPGLFVCRCLPQIVSAPLLSSRRHNSHPIGVQPSMKKCYPPHHMQSLSTPPCNKSLPIAICALFLAVTAFAQQPKIKQVYATSDHPLWRVDLKSQGYPANGDELQRRRGFANIDAISFVSDDLVTASFVTRESVPNLQRRDDPNHAHPYRLHALFLDALTGETLHTLEWPIDDPNAGIFPRRDGGFLLVTAEKIASYSVNWKHLNEIPFSDFHPTTATLGGIAESPDASSLVIQFLVRNSAMCFRIRTDTLDYAIVPCGTLEVFTVSDDRIVEPPKLPGEDSHPENTPSHAYIERGAVRLRPSASGGIPQFINNDAMALYSPKNISILDRAGKVTFSQDFNPRERWIDELGRPLRASQSGQRFAIVTNRSPFTRNAPPAAIHISTGDIPAEMPFDIDVCDLTVAQCIYTLRINGEHLHKVWGLALSPNGNKLAIDSGGTIQIFALPK
jgi:hypothetical protein